MLSAPELLIAFRAFCGPALFVLACFRFNGWILTGVLLAAVLSDILDGVIARRKGIDSPALRMADTIVDTLFYAAAGLALGVAVPGAYDEAWLALSLLIAVHVSRTTFEMIKFGRVASYHMWSSKVLGVLLAFALAVGFVSGRPTALLTVGLWLGVGNELEGFTASAILPAWQCDVPSLFHALRGR
jgi:CDP-diacylglycerol--glycerol-3-phosphate 3-phosphatidyltransferase